MFLASRRINKRLTDALVTLPLPVAADIALFCARLPDAQVQETRTRAQESSNAPIAPADAPEGGPSPDFFNKGVWAIFGEACPKRPFAFTDLLEVAEPSWDQPEKRLAWLRLSGRDWPHVDEVRSTFEQANVTLPDDNWFWHSVLASSSLSLSIVCAVPPSLRARIGNWILETEYTDKALQREADNWVNPYEEPCDFSSYLMAWAGRYLRH